MSDILNNDKSFREKLENFSVQPPPHVWENIQGQMAALKRKKRLATIGWISAAAVIVFAFLTGWFFYEQTGELMPVTVEQQKVQPKSEENESNVKHIENDVEESKIIQTEKTELGGSEKHSEVNRDLVASNNFKSLEKVSNNSFLAPVERFSVDLIKGIEAIFEIDEQKASLAERQIQQQEIELTKIEKVLVAENARIINISNEKEKGWILGMHLSPGYSSYTVNHTDQYARNMTYSSEKGNSNIGGGFSVQYKTSKKLRIESGVYYAQSGQKSGNSHELFSFGKYDELAFSAPEKLDGSQPTFSNTVQLNNSGIAMNSTAGVINMSGTPKGAEISAAPEDSRYSSSNTLLTNGEFAQVFEFVEIPFYLRYSVIDKKIGVELLGGLNAGVLVGNSAYIDNEFGNQRIGSTEDISTLNLSGTVGIGVNYALGKHFSVAVEPRVNYYLNSINSNPEVNYRPYRIGIFTGLYYEF